MIPAVSLIYAGIAEGSHQVPLHRHDGLELLCFFRGRASIRLAGSDWRLQAGELLLLPPGCEHDQRNHGRVRNGYLVLRCLDWQPATPSRLRLAPQDPLPRWIEDLAAGFSAGDPACDALAAACIAHLRPLLGADAPRGRHPATIRALTWLRGHFLEPLDPEACARAAGVSVSHLRALLRQDLGHGLREAQHALRLALAQRLLRSTRLSVAAVAAAAGFEDANYFGRLFRQHQGESPGTWRRRYQR